VPIEAPTDAATPMTARTRIAARRAKPKGSIAGRVAVVTTSSGSAASSEPSSVPRDVLVCVREKTGEAVCVDAEPTGEYAIAGLPDGEYAAWASAKGFAGPRWANAAGSETILLHPGEQRADIDLQLLAGAVEVAGIVRDLRGTAVGGALVVVNSGDDASFTARATTDGNFTAWAQPGAIRCEATAAGYTEGLTHAFAPARGIVIELIPAATVSGIVIEARTKRPIAGASVEIGHLAGDTDADGKFRIEGLPPGRYTPTATAIGSYGEATESLLAPLGGTVDGVVIEMHAVAVVAARVLVDNPQRTPCPAGAGVVSLWQSHNGRGEHARTDEDGFVLLEGMLPGTYEVTVRCEGYVSAVPYPDLVIESSDLDDVVWLVNTGARVIGHVRSANGQPIADAHVGVNSAGGESFATGMTDATGAYVIDGLVPGAVNVQASADDHARSDTLLAGQTTLAKPLTFDIVLQPVSKLVVEVVDAAGAPLDDIPIRLVGREEHEERSWDGEVEFDAIAPGTYTATTGRAEVRVTVGPGETRTRLVAEPLRGTLTGKVVTSTGAIVTDAFITIRPHGGGGLGAERTTLTHADGTFRFDRLLETDYTVRAYREGGAEVITEHVRVGSTITLELRDTGEISGMVVTTDGRPAHDYTVDLTGAAAYYSRSERVFHTNGAFTFHDVPPGNYRVSVESSKMSTAYVDVTAGGHVDNIQLTVQSGYAIRGRLLAPDGSPRPYWKLQLTYEVRTYARDGESRRVTVSDVVSAISGPGGQFMFRGVPAGTATLAAADVSQNVDAEVTDLRSFDIPSASVDLGIVTAP
jgi:protocatechuate 3,4-dioxygenase beta subunit